MTEKKLYTVEEAEKLSNSKVVELYKKYIEIFHKTTMRSIYYHLNKGVSLGVFKIDKVEQAKGDYSWGTGVRRVIFSFGPNAKPKKDVRGLKRLKK